MNYPHVPKVWPYTPRIVFDLDGTLAVDTWPDPYIGEPLDEGVRMLRHYGDQGFEIWIHTARPQTHYLAIINWLRRHSLDIYVYNVVCGKPVASLYVDDRSFNPKGATA